LVHSKKVGKEKLKNWGKKCGFGSKNTTSTSGRRSRGLGGEKKQADGNDFLRKSKGVGKIS